MKLATIRNGRPDGQLVVVSRNMKSYVSAGRVAPNLQAALDEWEQAAPRLNELQKALDEEAIAGQPFDPALAMAPLPRAYQWIDGAGYLGHLERVRSLKGSTDAGLQSQNPLLYQGASDSLSAASDPMLVPGDDLAVDFEAEVAVITGEVPMNASPEIALSAVRLITICNDVSLRRLVVDDLQNGFGFFHAKPSTSFAPVVVTPDEVGTYWRDGRLHADVQVSVNGKPYGRLKSGEGMHFGFAELIAAATRTRRLGTGTIVGSGTIANEHDHVLPLGPDEIGFGCIAEARTAEKVKFGKARTPFLKLGDEVHIEAFGTGGDSLFGAIRQKVVRYR